MIDTRTYLVISDYAGNHKYPVIVIGETKTKYRIQLTMETKLAGRNRWGKSGDVVLVPKYAIRQDSIG